MTDSEVKAVYRTAELDEYPTFDASYFIDEEETPISVTIWSDEGNEEVSTEWISCPATYAIPIEATR